MPKWVLEDDCLAPRPQLKIEYIGPNPFGIYRKTEDLLKKIWQVGSVDYWERDFRWDVARDPREFFARVCVNRGMDFRSKIFVEVSMQGTQFIDSNKNGKLTILIGAKLQSEFELKSAFQRSPIYKGLLLIYNKIFYRNVRSGYLKICQDFLDKTNREFRANLSVPTA